MIGRSRDSAAVARVFWDQAGLGDAFPRPIERAVALVLPLTIVRLPSLGVGAVADWLARCGVGVPLPSDDRPFMGCLLARRGHGVVFVDGADDPAEQRLTIAHEAAHFLHDYLWPRNDVLSALGEDAADVLDGLRPPTHAERATAVLRRVRLGPHLHRLPRDGDETLDPAVADGEALADALALELLAPRADWFPRLTALQSTKVAGGPARRSDGGPDGIAEPDAAAEHNDTDDSNSAGAFGQDAESDHFVATARLGGQARRLLSSIGPHHPADDPTLPSHAARALAARYGVPAHVFDRLIRRHHTPRPVSFLTQMLAAAREAR